MFSSIYDCIYSAVASSATVSVSLYSYNMLFAVLLTSNLVCSKLSPIFNGFDAINVVRLFDFEKKAALTYKYAKWKHKIFRIPKVVEYKKASSFFVGDEEYEENIIPTIIPNWDHSPRSRGKSLVLNHAEPSYFARHMKEAIKRIENKPLDHRLAFVKSWNEWAEGNYLEPDLHYGKRYLEVIKKNVVEG